MNELDNFFLKKNGLPLLRRNPPNNIDARMKREAKTLPLATLGATEPIAKQITPLEILKSTIIPTNQAK